MCSQLPTDNRQELSSNFGPGQRLGNLHIWLNPEKQLTPQVKQARIKYSYSFN